MADGQATVTFATLERDRIQGGEFTLSRGVSPSSCRIFIDPQAALSQIVGTLKFEQDGRSVEFKQAALAPQTLRLFRGRDAWIWSVQVFDRRWKWRYPRISGEYNVRGCDGAIVANTRRTLKELLEALLTALGEPNAVLDSIPEGIFPAVSWDAVRADLELAHLAEQHGLVPFLGIDDKAYVVPLGSGAGLEATIDDKIPRWQYEQGVLPANIEVQGGRRIFQQAILLRPVGLDTDGVIKPINDLSYVPADGWGADWFTTFSNVPIGVRHLALQSVWRWYEPVLSSIQSDESLTDLKQLVLYQSAAEAPVRNDGVVRCSPPQVRGVFWAQTDLNTNTGEGTYYAGNFEIDSENRLVKFPYPVVALDNGIIDPTLYLITAFSLIGQDGFQRRAVERGVGGQGPNRIEIRDNIRDVRNDEPLYTRPLDTSSDALNELNAIAEAIADGHQGRWATEVWLEGVRQVNLTGKIAQVRWSCGIRDTRPATTRASENMEFDTFVPHHQERRRRETGNQIAGRVLR